jgi:hypothetical protein
MMKKELILKSKLGIPYSIYESTIDNRKLIDLLCEDGFQKVKQYFDKYFNQLIENSISSESVELISTFRESLEDKFYNDVYSYVIRYKEDIEGVTNKKSFVNAIIELVVHPLFFYSELSIAVLTGNRDNLINLVEFKQVHTNQKDKEWREQLYKIADKIYKEKKHLDKTKSLKEAFESLPNKEQYRDDYLDNFKSIYEKFRKR